MDSREAFRDPGELAGRLAAHGELADEGLSTIAWLGLRSSRPPLLERLRHRDVGQLSDSEKACVAALFATITVRHPRRRARRHTVARRGRVDARARLCEQLRHRNPEHPEALGEAMVRRRALAQRVVWATPHAGRSGDVPVRSGLVAALPHGDALVAGHSLAAFDRLLAEVGRA